MNWLSLGFWVLPALFIGVSTFVGLSRGLNRALLRLVLVLICAVLAFFLRGVVTDAVLGIEIDGVTIEQTILNGLPEQIAGLGDAALAIVKVSVYAVIFVAVFYALKLLSWAIVYPICKMFIRSAEKRKIAKLPEDASKSEYTGIARKRRGFGALVGLCQGVVIAICICMPLGAMVYQADQALVALNSSSSEVATAYVSADGMPDGISPSESEDSILPKEIQEMLDGYANSAIGKFYGEICQSSFDSIASVNTEDGKITFSGVVSVVREAPKFADKLDSINAALDGIDYNNPESLSQLKAVMRSLDELVAEMPGVAKDTLNTLIAQVGKKLTVDVFLPSDSADISPILTGMVQALTDTLEQVRFTEISFENEIVVLENIMTDISDVVKSEQITDEGISEILSDMSESNLIVPILNNITLSDLGAEPFDAEVLASFETHLSSMEANNPDLQQVIGALRNLLGITSEAV